MVMVTCFIERTNNVYIYTICIKTFRVTMISEYDRDFTPHMLTGQVHSACHWTNSCYRNGGEMNMSKLFHAQILINFFVVLISCISGNRLWHQIDHQYSKSKPVFNYPNLISS